MLDPAAFGGLSGLGQFPVLRHSSEFTLAARQGRQFTQFAFGLIALAGLAFAGLINHEVVPLDFSAEARGVIAWSLVGLAAADAVLLLSWERIAELLTGA